MRTALVLLAALALAACAGPGPTSVGPPPAPPPPAPPPAAPPSASASVGDVGPCQGPPPAPGFECMRNCGAPVARADDPPPGYSWLSAADAENRRKFGCPICLPAEARIATPRGQVAVSTLAVGDTIWTLDEHGRRIATPLVYAASTPVAAGHEVVRVRLDDGRSVTASPGHPAIDGTPLGAIERGAPFAGARVVSIEHVTYAGDRTWDVLPGGPTGAYWVDGVLLRTSLHAGPP